MQSVHITTNVASFNSAYGEVYSIQHYLITFVSDLRQVGGFFRVLLFSPWRCFNLPPLSRYSIKENRIWIFNETFNNTWDTKWRSVLLLFEIGLSGEKHLSTERYPITLYLVHFVNYGREMNQHTIHRG
jgi:hypothetical protein